MSNSYFLDLGFDLQAIQKSNTLSYLENGFVLQDMPTAPVNIQHNDTLSFGLYNLTSSSIASPSSLSIVGGEMTFKAATQNQASTSPFAEPKISITPQQSTASVLVKSAIFSRGTQDLFPRWTVGTTQTFVNTGKFLLTVAVIIQIEGGAQRTFVVDPEMVIGSIG